MWEWFQYVMVGIGIVTTLFVLFIVIRVLWMWWTNSFSDYD